VEKALQGFNQVHWFFEDLYVIDRLEDVTLHVSDCKYTTKKAVCQDPLPGLGGKIVKYHDSSDVCFTVYGG
jgi:hypothetical protein